MDPAAISAWLKTSTSGQGATLLLGTLAALSQGSLSLHDAVPVLLGGVVLIIWPQKPQFAEAVKTTVTDLEPLVKTATTDLQTVLQAYRTGLEHGAQVTQSAASQTSAQVFAASAQQAPATS